MSLPPLQSWLRRTWQVLLDDARRFYAWRNLVRLAIGFAIGAVLANSPVDQWLEDAYRQRVHSESTGAQRCQKGAKWFGDRRVVILAPITAMVIGTLAPPCPVTLAVGAWGSQMSRALVVGAPVTFGGTWLLGGDRPKEGNGSGWDPRHRQDHGISGHAFAGALPFLVMAGMTANPYGQAALYVCSGFTAWSRVDSQSHYPSQIFLGWWLAFLAVRVARKARPPAKSN